LLPRVCDDATCARVVIMLLNLVAGCGWCDSISKAGLQPGLVSCLKLWYPTAQRLIHVAQDAGDQVKAGQRLDAAHTRAVDGVEEILASGGKIVGSQRRYSDRLLELLLRADNPERFGRSKDDAGGNPAGVSITISFAESGVPRDGGGPTIDVTPHASKAATKRQQSS